MHRALGRLFWWRKPQPELIRMDHGSTYCHQLARVRRFLTRVEAKENRDGDAYQDDVWAFFQNCWHLKDWVKHDTELSRAARKRDVRRAEKSVKLGVCHDIANGTKHMELARPQAGASHANRNYFLVVGGQNYIDCQIKFGDGARRSAREVAHECLEEWERILTEVGLSLSPPD
jgi:hypothetical protein